MWLAESYRVGRRIRDVWLKVVKAAVGPAVATPPLAAIRLSVTTRLLTMLVALASLALGCAGCSPGERTHRGGQGPTTTDFCALASGWRPLNGARIRVQAVGLFSDHGAYLAHPECPQFHADWEEAQSFRSDPSWGALGDAIFSLEEANIESGSLATNDLAVDISARVRWRGNRVALVVDKVYSTRPAPRLPKRI